MEQENYLGAQSSKINEQIDKIVDDDEKSKKDKVWVEENEYSMIKVSRQENGLSMSPATPHSHSLSVDNIKLELEELKREQENYLGAPSSKINEQMDKIIDADQQSKKDKVWVEENKYSMIKVSRQVKDLIYYIYLIIYFLYLQLLKVSIVKKLDSIEKERLYNTNVLNSRTGNIDLPIYSAPGKLKDNGILIKAFEIQNADNTQPLKKSFNYKNLFLLLPLMFFLVVAYSFIEFSFSQYSALVSSFAENAYYFALKVALESKENILENLKLIESIHLSDFDISQIHYGRYLGPFASLYLVVQFVGLYRKIDYIEEDSFQSLLLNLKNHFFSNSENLSFDQNEKGCLMVTRLVPLYNVGVIPFTDIPSVQVTPFNNILITLSWILSLLQTKKNHINKVKMLFFHCESP
ncbi:hypothetical protein ROZALSC1DRAFT_25321 [Rozella allomycis CSF55]|uniref:Uncharacterized protein n=1 Tax=Rozella allomycis (strain CSF55) TaxID=988480 RepID=A0A4P9YCT6_ROZAC|nr:hypothetical protein ROZALSC1DRAFT_25321 [Rozella allomycis CSF55]